MSIVPPLLLLGAPAVPVLRGLPSVVVRGVLRPIVSHRWYHGLVKKLLHPATLWLLMNVAYLGWHVPAAFELTFRSELVHNLEHLCFLGTSIGFWWFVLQPWPARSRFPRWVVIPYLLTSDLLNTILSALLAFSGYLVLRSRALLGSLRAAYPGAPIGPRQVFGAYVAAVGFKNVVPAGGANIIQLFLTRSSIPGSGKAL